MIELPNDKCYAVPRDILERYAVPKDKFEREVKQIWTKRETVFHPTKDSVIMYRNGQGLKYDSGGDAVCGVRG